MIFSVIKLPSARLQPAFERSRQDFCTGNSRLATPARRLVNVRLPQKCKLFRQLSFCPTGRFSQTLLNFASAACRQDFQKFIETFSS
jgi:hypothetical protein